MDDYQKMYDEFFEHAMHLLNDHQKPAELIAGTMMAIAQRIYKTQLNEEEYQEMMEVIKDAPVKPYDIKNKRARTKKGRYKGDNKSTPFWNEAWIKGRSPKGKSPLRRFLDWLTT